MTDGAALGVYGASYRYRGTPVLEDVSFEMGKLGELGKGEILAVLGPNGAGKSTLLKFAAGLLPLARGAGSGVARVGGVALAELSADARARAVVYVRPELRAEFPLTAHEAVRMSGICHAGQGGDTDRAREAMQRCRCWDLRNRDLHSLSGGERQRVALARAIAQGSRILLLDETLSRMDLDHQALAGRLLRELAAEGRSIALVAHDLNVATEWADACLLLKRGRRIAFGPPREAITEANIRALYPDAALTVAPSPASGAPKVYFGVQPAAQK